MKKSIFSLKDKYVLITGALGLLGTQHIQAVADADGIPIILDLNQEAIDQKVLELDSKGIHSLGIKCDLTSEDSVLKLKEKLISDSIPLHSIINNAAINPSIDGKNASFTRIENTRVSDIYKHIDVSIIGPFLLAKHIHPIILKNNRYEGVILNISSDLGLIAPKQSLYSESGENFNSENLVKPLAYSIVKTGLLGFTRYLATYYNGEIRCNALCPGGVLNNQPEEFLKKVVREIPLGRMANKDEYKGAIIFLLSDASKYMNGSIVQMDGGRSTW